MKKVRKMEKFEIAKKVIIDAGGIASEEQRAFFARC